MNGGNVWAKLERSFSVELSWRSCSVWVVTSGFIFVLDGGIRNVAGLQHLILFNVLC